MTATNPVTSLKVGKRIADPVHELIRLTDLEAKVLQHPIFQRLREVTQLGVAKYVYPGAMHNRFTHSLGVLHNVTQMYDSAYRNYVWDPTFSGDIEVDHLFSEFMLQTTRLAAMCHDIGHYPYSHNLEVAIDWLAEEKIIPRSYRHEDLSAYLIKEMLGPILGDFTEQVAAIISGDLKPLGRCLFPAFLVSSAIDADRMDYLVRDAMHCGVDQGRFDRARLLDSVIPHGTVIDGERHDIMAFKSKGIEAVEQFLLARHRMHQTIYFNPTVVGFEAGIRRAYYRISSDDPPWDLPHVFFDEPLRFLEFNEATFFHQLKLELQRTKSWLVQPIVFRAPLRKVGPFFNTIDQDDQPEIESDERFNLLKSKQQELENPSTDWYQKDHWVYAENKTQTLVNPLPDKLSGTETSAKSELKNVILLVNAKGELVDPTHASFGHTFLPIITGHTYHRFLFFTSQDNTERINNELGDIIQQFEKQRR